MIRLVIRGKSLQNLDRIFNRWLIDRYRLETALQCAVLFNGLPILIERCRTDDLNLAAAQRRLENIGGIHAALGISGPHDIVNLINHEDDVPQLFDLVDQSLHSLLKLATELRSGHQRGQVQQIDLLFPQLIGHIPRHDTLGQTLGNSGLANARLADEAGIVLLPAIQNLDDPLDLLSAADNRVQLSLLGLAVQGDAVAL